jgi:putative OPT family oligopeptide transporter
VASGVFGGGLPWDMVAWGVALGAAVIGLDQWLVRSQASFRTPVLAVAVGIYLPLELSVAIFLGGLIAWVAGRRTPQKSERTGASTGLLFAAGLITGEALVGIVLAVPIVVVGRGDALAFWGEFSSPWPGVLLLVAVMGLLYRASAHSTDS